MGSDVVATDALGLIGTVGFVVPASLLIALVVGAVVRDRRLHAQDLARDPAGDDADGVIRRPGPPAR
jgi:hypothetical protein